MTRKETWRRRLLPLLMLQWSLLFLVDSAQKIPDASSTLLKMHKIFMTQPPHDASLYNILSVSPNATAAEITKSFRKLSRLYHPDKRRHSSHLSDEECQEKLQQVRQAYEVLKDDTTRLPYHKFGLLDTSMAAFLLTGGQVGKAIPNPQQEKLMQLMGYSNVKMSHRQRVFFMAANLMEQIRPLVEGAIDESTLKHTVAQECDALKKVPLGAQILRCIGRAYRHSGQAVLRKHYRKQKLSLFGPLHIGAELSDVMRDKMRNAKHVLTAAVASGRVVLTEKLTQRASKNDNKVSVPVIDYHMDSGLSRIDQLIGEDDIHDLDSHLDSIEEMKESERQKAQAALLESLQVQALWKISKIDLDRTVQEACSLILSGEYFFFPSHQSPKCSDWNQNADGWVGSTGQVVNAGIGRLRAAAALVLVGDVMVQCSKEGTAWVE